MKIKLCGKTAVDVWTNIDLLSEDSWHSIWHSDVFSDMGTAGLQPRTPDLTVDVRQCPLRSGAGRRKEEGGGSKEGGKQVC